jgi:hypothetical protein
MSLVLIATLVALGLFLAMVLAIEIGRYLGRRRLAQEPDGTLKGVGAAEGAVFGLLGLLIAFTFSGAASRFEDRRHLITDEANAIGTAWLRLDILPEESQPRLRELFRRYLDSRLVVYSYLEDEQLALRKLAVSNGLQLEIWSAARAATRLPGAPPQAAQLTLPALNEMFDITTTRTVAVRNHPPLAIFILLGACCLVGSLLVGYTVAENKTRRGLHTLGFAFIMALAVYVIIDLEYPRLGLIRIDAADQVLIDLRASMD